MSKQAASHDGVYISSHASGFWVGRHVGVQMGWQ